MLRLLIRHLGALPRQRFTDEGLDPGSGSGELVGPLDPAQDPLELSLSTELRDPSTDDGLIVGTAANSLITYAPPHDADVPAGRLTVTVDLDTPPEAGSYRVRLATVDPASGARVLFSR